MGKLLLLLVVTLVGCASIQSNETRSLKDSRSFKKSNRCYRCVPKIARLRSVIKEQKDDSSDEDE